MKTIYDLTEVLFKQLEKVSDDNLTEEEMKKVIKQNDAVVKTASILVETGNLILRSKKAQDDNFRADSKLPSFLIDERSESNE